MITLVNELPEIKAQSVALVKIGCTFCAYGAYPKIALFWEQKNEENETSALFCLLDGNLTVFAKEVNEELALFIKSLAPATVFADSEIALKLGVKGEEFCVASFCSDGNSPQKGQADTRKVYRHFKNDFQVNESEFIADLSHRIRHSAAFCIVDDSGAAVVQTAGESAYITGICVLKESRKKGVGSEILNRIKDSFSGTVFVCCEKSVLPFYLKNSFEPKGHCIIGRI